MKKYTNDLRTEMSLQALHAEDASQQQNQDLGPVLMSAHPGAKKKPASNTWPCLPAGAEEAAAPAEGMVLPQAGPGPTLGDPTTT